MTVETLATADAALARAVVYRGLSIAFGPPSETKLVDLGAHDGFPSVAAALRFLDHCGHGTANSLAKAAARLESLTPVDAGRVADDYARLFGHITRGLICACETEYGPDNGFHQPQQLADIAGYYLAFGLRPSASGEIRPDHLSCECEFMDFLSRKRARLIDDPVVRGELAETLEVTDKVERAFVRDHLGRFGRAFGSRVASEDRDGFFGAMGRVLLAFVEAECGRLGVEAGPTDLAVRPDQPDDAPMACGTADSETPAPLAFHRRAPVAEKRQ